MTFLHFAQQMCSGHEASSGLAGAADELTGAEVAAVRWRLLRWRLFARAQGAFHGKYKDEEYAMASHWDTNFRANLFGVRDPGLREAQQRRSNLEDDTNPSAFPGFARACFLCEETPSGQSHSF